MPSILVLSLIFCALMACKPSAQTSSPNKEALSSQQAELLRRELVQTYQQNLLQNKGAEWEAKRLTHPKGLSLPFFYRVWGEKPPGGYPLFISMHGGGGTTAEVNDQQYQNQQRLYDRTMANLSGVYLAPRAPTNTWNLWHEDHIDDLFVELILLAAAKLEIDLNRVYLLGYSAGGDGVYQLAPRLADRLGAAAMMAGHPNDARPESLRNLPFALHMGSEDAAYDRNRIAAEWGGLLDSLAKVHGAYPRQVKIHQGYGHWMKLQDSIALPWMSQHKRNPYPSKILWAYDKARHQQFYWLAVPPSQKAFKAGEQVLAEYDYKDNTVVVYENPCDTLLVYLDEAMNLDLERPIRVYVGGRPGYLHESKLVFQEKIPRKAANLRACLARKGGDPQLLYSAGFKLIGQQVEPF